MLPMAKKILTYTVTQKGKDPIHLTVEEFFEFKFANMQTMGTEWDFIPYQDEKEKTNKKADSYLSFMRSLSEIQKLDVQHKRLTPCYNNTDDAWYLKQEDNEEINISLVDKSDPIRKIQKEIKAIIIARADTLYEDSELDISYEEFQGHLNKITFIVK